MLWERLPVQKPCVPVSSHIGILFAIFRRLQLVNSFIFIRKPPKRGLSGSAGVGRRGMRWDPWDAWDGAGRVRRVGCGSNGHVTVGSGLSHTSSVR